MLMPIASRMLAITMSMMTNGIKIRNPASNASFSWLVTKAGMIAWKLSLSREGAGGGGGGGALGALFVGAFAGAGGLVGDELLGADDVVAPGGLAIIANGTLVTAAMGAPEGGAGAAAIAPRGFGVPVFACVRLASS